MEYEESVKRYFEFVNLRKQGWTFRRIGERFGISHQAVRHRVVSGLPQERSRKNPIWETQPRWRRWGRERTRYKVRIRDNFTCQVCGEVRTPEMVGKNRIFPKLHDVHHLNGLCGKKTKKYDKMKDSAELITLCHKCHFNRHDYSVTLRGG